VAVVGTERKYEKPVRMSCPCSNLYLRNTNKSDMSQHEQNYLAILNVCMYIFFIHIMYILLIMKVLRLV